MIQRGGVFSSLLPVRVGCVRREEILPYANRGVKLQIGVFMSYFLNETHIDYITLVGNCEIEGYCKDVCEGFDKAGQIDDIRPASVAGGRYRGTMVGTPLGTVSWGSRGGVGEEPLEYCAQVSGFIADTFFCHVTGTGGEGIRKCTRLDVALTLPLGKLDHIGERDRVRGYVKEDNNRDGTVYRGTRKSDRLMRIYQKGEGDVRLEVQFNKSLANPLFWQGWRKGAVVSPAELLKGELERVRGRRWYSGSVLDDFSSHLEGERGEVARVEERDDGYEKWLGGVIAHLLARPDSAKRVFDAIRHVALVGRLVR